MRNYNMIGVAGDWHGDGRWAATAIDHMAHEGASAIFQVGDFGVWPGNEGIDFLDRVNIAARNNNLTVYAVRGNHDSNYWEEALASPNAVLDIACTNGVYVRSNVVLLPRTGSFFMGQGLGRREFFVAGGAASIDGQYRVPGRSWWPEEQLTDAEVDAIPEHKVDILLTHDCSNRTPFPGRLVPHMDSQIHRQRIDRVLSKVKPSMHFHGHMHHYYEWCNLVDGYYLTDTFGLDMNGTQRNYGILDTEEMTFKVVA